MSLSKIVEYILKKQLRDYIDLENNVELSVSIFNSLTNSV
jgi:hypothetical protein